MAAENISAVKRSTACVLLWAAVAAQAHETDPAAIPDTGLRATAAVAATLAEARQALPGAMLPGVLGTGQTLRDRRGLRLEHAVAELAGRAPFGLGAQLAVGLHNRDKPHLEAAWLDLPLWRDLHLGAGRHTVPTTPTLGQAGHFDRFALMPLAKRALFEGNWTEDGASLAWRSHNAPGAWPDRAGVGVWRGRSFPAGGRSPQSNADRPITLHAGWNIGTAWQLDTFAARMRPTGRGALVQNTAAGHSHGSPVCSTSLTDRVCFDGRVAVWGASLRWAPDAQWSASATVLSRSERGQLYATGGDTHYHGRTTGGWLDLTWRFSPTWEAAARAEHLQARHDMAGPGAASVAADANLLDNRAKQRAALALAWLGTPGWRLGVELGDDRSLGVGNAYVLLRAVWLLDQNWAR